MPPSVGKESVAQLFSGRGEAFPLDERSALIQSIKATGGNMSQRQELLGVNRMTVRNRTLKYGVQVEKKMVDS